MRQKGVGRRAVGKKGHGGRAVVQKGSRTEGGETEGQWDRRAVEYKGSETKGLWGRRTVRAV